MPIAPLTHKRILRRNLLATVTAGALALGLLGTPSVQASGDPAEQTVRDMVKDAFAALRDPELQKNPKARVAKLRTIIDRAFNWERMAKSSLGHHWKTLTDAQRAEFVSVFKELLANRYKDDVDRFKGTEDVKVAGTDKKETLRIVRTVLTTASKEDIPIDYTLSEESGKWGVEDVSIERVSMVNQYRSTFNNFLTNHSFDEMMKKLRSKLGNP